MSDKQPKLQCPCCDYYTLEKRHVYEICPICFWVDEFDIDVTKLDVKSEENHMTLREGRENFKQIGACNATILEKVRHLEDRSQYTYRRRNLT